MIINYNLPDLLFKELSSGCKFEENFKKPSDSKVAFVLVSTLSLQERIILRRLMSERIHIVIVSSLQEAAIFGWKIGAFYYLEYPFSNDQFSILIQKMEVLKSGVYSNSKRIKLSYTGGFDIINLNDINLINGLGDYCQIYFQDQESKTYTYRLKKFESVLDNHINFLKLSRSVIININNVAQIKGNKVKFSKSPNLNVELSTRVIKRLKENMFWLNI
ncbi:MAG: LytTR family transcriptional regulator [Chitinophagales bacterium]|nr:LytTR family transcriptional regulator [Chitinophagales bacterium]